MACLSPPYRPGHLQLLQRRAEPGQPRAAAQPGRDGQLSPGQRAQDAAGGTRHGDLSGREQLPGPRHAHHRELGRRRRPPCAPVARLPRPAATHPQSCPRSEPHGSGATRRESRRAGAQGPAAPGRPPDVRALPPRRLAGVGLAGPGGAVASAGRERLPALLGLRAARAPGAPPVAGSLPLQLLPSSRPVWAPLPPALPGAPGAREPAVARAGAAGPAGGPPARGLGPGVAPAPRFPAQLGGRDLRPAQLGACPLCPPGLRALDAGAVDAAAVLPRGLPGGGVGRGPRLAARTARLPPRPCPPATLLGRCLPSPPTLCQPRPLAPCSLAASGAQGQDPRAEHRLQGQWGAGRGQQGGLWGARLPPTLRLEADLQLGVRSVRKVSATLVPGQLESPRGPASFQGQIGSGFYGFCHEILAIRDPVTDDVFMVILATSVASGTAVGWAFAIFLCKTLPNWPGVTGCSGGSLPAGSWSPVMAAGALV